MINCKCCHVCFIRFLFVQIELFVRFKVVKSFGVKGAVSADGMNEEFVLIGDSNSPRSRLRCWIRRIYVHLHM